MTNGIDYANDHRTTIAYTLKCLAKFHVFQTVVSLKPTTHLPIKSTNHKPNEKQKLLLSSLINALEFCSILYFNDKCLGYSLVYVIIKHYHALQITHMPRPPQYLSASHCVSCENLHEAPRRQVPAWK